MLAVRRSSPELLVRRAQRSDLGSSFSASEFWHRDPSLSPRQRLYFLVPRGQTRAEGGGVRECLNREEVTAGEKTATSWQIIYQKYSVLH